MCSRSRVRWRAPARGSGTCSPPVLVVLVAVVRCVPDPPFSSRLPKPPNNVALPGWQQQAAGVRGAQGGPAHPRRAEAGRRRVRRAGQRGQRQRRPRRGAPRGRRPAREEPRAEVQRVAALRVPAARHRAPWAGTPPCVRYVNPSDSIEIELPA